MIGLGGITVLSGLVLAGQTDLVAWIIVGAVLTVVFGTPLLCVVGLFLFYVWAVTRMGRSRRRPPSTKTGGVQQVAQTVIVGEVVLDE
jgi:flagellar biogenesis protein FliO